MPQAQQATPAGLPNHFVAESPEAVGVDAEKLAAVVERVRREVDEGLLPSAQIAVAREGKLALFKTFGNATNNTLYCVFSSTKAITSAAAWLVIEAGDLKTHEIVADIVPEFGTNGKEAITVEQLFLHSAGFPHAPFRPTDWFDRDRRLARFASWRLNWPPGSQFEYHPTSSMWVIAEIIERRTGRAPSTISCARKSPRRSACQVCISACRRLKTTVSPRSNTVARHSPARTTRASECPNRRLPKSPKMRSWASTSPKSARCRRRAAAAS